MSSQPFRAPRAKRHLLDKLPCEMWKEVLGCARADDYGQSKRVSGEYYVLMRLCTREIPLAPRWDRPEVLPRSFCRSAAIWAGARKGSPIRCVHLDRSFLSWDDRKFWMFMSIFHDILGCSLGRFRLIVSSVPPCDEKTVSFGSAVHYRFVQKLSEERT